MPVAAEYITNLLCCCPIPRLFQPIFPKWDKQPHASFTFQDNHLSFSKHGVQERERDNARVNPWWEQLVMLLNNPQSNPLPWNETNILPYKAQVTRFHNSLQLWSLGFVKHFTCHHYAIVKLKGKCQLSICLGKLSIGKIVGKMPIIHLFGKRFQMAKLQGKCQLSIRLEKFLIGKIVGQMPFSILFGKIFNWQIEVNIPSSSR